MERKEYILSKKFYLKGLVQQIRSLKSEIKHFWDDKKYSESESFKKRSLECELANLKYQIRHEYIAYGLARKVKEKCFDSRGYLTPTALKIYHTIETKVRDDNKADFGYVKQIFKSYPAIQEIHDETAVCADAE